MFHWLGYTKDGKLDQGCAPSEEQAAMVCKSRGLVALEISLSKAYLLDRKHEVFQAWKKWAQDPEGGDEPTTQPAEGVSYNDVGAPDEPDE